MAHLFEPTSRPPPLSPDGTIATLKAMLRQSAKQRSSRSWSLTSAPRQLSIGSAPSCDWVIGEADVPPRAFGLRWDGRCLIASRLAGSRSEEVIVRPNRPCDLGMLELLLTLSSASRPPRPPNVASAPPRERVLGGTMTRIFVPTRVPVATSEATVIIADPVLAAVAKRDARTTRPRWQRGWLALVLLPWVFPLALVGRAVRTAAPRTSPRPTVAAPTKQTAPGHSTQRAPTEMATAVASHSAPPTPAPPASTAVAPPPAATAVAPPPPRLARRVYSEPEPHGLGGCSAASANDAPSAENHLMLQLAIQAYQAGRRSEAHLLFQMLACRPDVGPAARFMARLLSPETAAMLPRDRPLRVRRLLDEIEHELAEEPDLWAQRESLASAELVNPQLNVDDFVGQPKCNIFIGEMLYRAGFVPPATPAAGQRVVPYPSVNQMVATARRLSTGGTWEHADGVQWFDVVAQARAQPGDLVLIAAKDRGDHLATEHGHVEIINRVTSADGVITSLGTVGARSRGVKLSPTAGRVFGDVLEGGSYLLSDQAVIVRPRMR